MNYRVVIVAAVIVSTLAGLVACKSIEVNEEIHNNCVGGDCSDGGGGSDAASGGDSAPPADGGTEAGCSPCSGDLLWIKSYGGTQDDFGRRMAIDKQGNVYLLGQAGAAFPFADDAGAGDGGVSVSGNFIAKLDTNGKALWSVAIAGSVTMDSIAVDSIGNVYVSGSVGIGGVAPTWDGANTTASNLRGTHFVLKGDTNGRFAWGASTSVGGANTTILYALGVGSDDDPMITAYTQQATSFKGTNIPAGGYTLKLAKATGNFVWMHRFIPTGDAGTSTIFTTAIVPAPSGETNVIGDYKGQLDFGSGGALQAPDFQVFLLRLTQGGLVSTAPKNFVRYDGRRSPPPDGGVDQSINFSAAAYVPASPPFLAIAGNFNGWGHFNGTILQVGDAGAAQPATFLALADPSTYATVAARSIEGLTGINSVVGHASGTVIVGGTFYGTSEFGGQSLLSAGLGDGFVATYDQTLRKLLWAKRLGGTNVDAVTGVGLDPSGAIVVVGNYRGSADFPGGKQMNSNGASSDVFLMKIAR